MSQASAVQRAGRAGRVENGVCIRLYSVYDFEHRAAYIRPCIEDADLTPLRLELAAMGCDWKTLNWLTCPPDTAADLADQRLLGMGAIDRHGKITDFGSRLIAFGLTPRQAAVLVFLENEDEAVKRCAAGIMAVLQEERTYSNLLISNWKFKQQQQSVKRAFGQFCESLNIRPYWTSVDVLDQNQCHLLNRAFLRAWGDQIGRVEKSLIENTRHAVRQACVW